MKKYRNLIRIPLIAIMIFSLSACDVSRIDSKNSETIGNSMEKVIKGKSNEDLIKFQEGFGSILNYAYAKTHNGKTIQNYNGLDIVAITFYLKNNSLQKPEEQAEIDKIVFSILNGMSFKDVVNAKEIYNQETITLVNKINK
jgi:uncharacterized lipoprotein YehR (DUF1307 family)